MQVEGVIDVADVIDNQKMGRLHWQIVAFAFSLLLIDGYEIVVVAFVAPALQQLWGFPPSALGPLFGSAVIGSAIGPMIFGYVADRWGRRPTMLLGTFWFGIFTLAAVWSTSLNQLMVLRLLAGLGIGGVLGIASALVAEFAPRRIRGSMIVMAVVGVALGGGFGAFVASRLLATHSWQIVFWIGGLLPLGFVAIGLFIVPESIRYLTLRPERRAELVLLLGRLSPSLAVPADARFILGDEVNASRFSFKALFHKRLAIITPLIWISNFVTLLLLYFVSQWTPILLSAAGAPVQRAALATAAFQTTGFLGAFAVMRPVDKAGFLPVPILFAIAAPVIALMGMQGLSDTLVICLAGAAGFCVIGIQFANVATQSQVYPTYVRAWGVGSCFGAGRVGALFGSAVGGLLIGAKFPINTLFYLSGAAALVGVVSGIMLVPLYKKQLREMTSYASATS